MKDRKDEKSNISVEGNLEDKNIENLIYQSWLSSSQ